MRRIILVLTFFLILEGVLADCADCGGTGYEGDCKYCDGNTCENRAFGYSCSNAAGAAVWDNNICDGKGTCYTPDANKAVCESMGDVWPNVYEGNNIYAPCCGDDLTAGHGDKENFVTSDFVCLHGVACGDNGGEEVVDENENGVFEINEDGCSCVTEDFMKRCSTDFASGEWTGMCVDINCCEDLLVDKDSSPACKTIDELEESLVGKTCDDVSDAEYNSGNIVKPSPDGTKFGCCDATSCWSGTGCKMNGYFVDKTYCNEGDWVICGEDSSGLWETTPECQTKNTLTCHSTGWSQTEVSCGETCSDGRCGDPDENGAFECLVGGSSNRNLPEGAVCTQALDCCTLSCVGGRCAAAESCSESNPGVRCSIDTRTGICASDYRTGVESGFVCCDSDFGELAVIQTSESDVRCVSSMDDYESWSCNNDTHNTVGTTGVVRVSPQGDSACCQSGECMLESCVPSYYYTPEWSCYYGTLSECTEENYCVENYGKQCNTEGWIENPLEMCGDGLCIEQTCITCNNTNETADITGLGDVTDNWLCTNEGFESCKSDYKTITANQSDYLCNNYIWYECSNATSSESKLVNGKYISVVPKENTNVQTWDSDGIAISEGEIIGNYTCYERKWHVCDPKAKIRLLKVENEEIDKNYWCNTDGNWLDCNQLKSVYLKQDGSYACYCASGQRCIQFDTGKHGLCTGGTCCSGWTTDGLGCYTNQTEVCRWRDGQACDSLADGIFSPTGICASEACCIDDGPGGRMVIGEQSSYQGDVKCVSAPRPEDLGKACDTEPDGAFDGFIGYLYNELGCCQKEQACTFEEFTPETPKNETVVTPPIVVPQGCKDCSDNDECTRDYCEAGVCKHEVICATCGDGVCESDECTTCADDCTAEDCADGVCDPLEGCNDPDCNCDFNYDTNEPTNFLADDPKSFYITVSNDGNFKEMFSISIDANTNYKIDDDSFYLDAGESKKVKVRVIEDVPGTYSLDLEIKPEHGTAYAESITLEIEKGADVPITEKPIFKTAITAILVLVGLISSLALGKKLFSKKPQAPVQYTPYAPGWQEQMRQQYYYSNTPQDAKAWQAQTAEKLVPETEATKKKKAKDEALKKFAEALKKVQETTKNDVK